MSYFWQKIVFVLFLIIFNIVFIRFIFNPASSCNKISVLRMYHSECHLLQTIIKIHHPLIYSLFAGGPRSSLCLKIQFP